MQFDRNWIQITYDFLIKSEIERMKTKIKRTPNMNDVLETSSKIHLSILYLKITSFIEFRSLEILKKSVLVHKFICIIF